VTRRPENCCAAGCARPTSSHSVAVDVSEHDAVGLPTLAGSVCHRCWVEGTEGGEPVSELLDDRGALLDRLDIGRMVAVGKPIEEMVSS